MPYRASPLRNVPDLALAAVGIGSGAGGAHVAGTDFTQAAAVSLSTSTVQHSSGFASGVYAVLPDKHNYDMLRFDFGQPVMGNADNTCTLGIWMRESDGGLRLIGQSVLANGVFPSVDIPNYDGRYWIAPVELAGTAPAVTVAVSVQGLYSVPVVYPA